MAAQCRIDRRHSALDVGLRRRDRHSVEHRMGKAVIGDGVALGQLAPRQRRMGERVAADQKEGGAHAFLPQRLENAFRGAGPRPVVEGEHYFLGRQRQGLGKLLAAHARRGSGIHIENARGAERAGIAGAGRRAVRGRGDRRRGERRQDCGPWFDGGDIHLP
jgi:non-ribosomal peptide synthetase component F